MRTITRRPALVACKVLILLALPLCAQEEVLVAEGSPARWIANDTDPGLGLVWASESYLDTAWETGVYGLGYETDSGAEDLILTTVPQGAASVYTRSRFSIPDVSAIRNLYIGADYDDGWVAWINGVEVYRSPEMPPGPLTWDADPSDHESSNRADPDYRPLEDISHAIPLLRNGENLLVAGVWNRSVGSSSDLVLVPTLQANLPNEMVRGPYLQQSAPGGAVIRWRTLLDTDSRLHLGTDPAAMAEAWSAPPATEHIAYLSGLLPETRYWYEITDGAGEVMSGGPDHTFLTPPPAGSDRPARIWVLGDSGTADEFAAAVRDAFHAFSNGESPDLWLMLGDNAYVQGNDAQYQRALFDMYPATLRSSPLWPTFGNHDELSADSVTQTGVYYTVFSLPTSGEAGGEPSGTEAFYSFDFANIHFVCLNTSDIDLGPTSPMREWMARDLAASTADWNIAFFHHPPHSAGSHDSDTDWSMTLVRENLMPALEAAGIDLVLSGHSHSYERSYFLDSYYGLSTEFGPLYLVDGGNGRIGGDGPYRKEGTGAVAHQGTVYVVAGSSGETGGGPLDHPAMYFSANLLGSLVLDVYQNRLDSRFLDAFGQVLDSFTMVKGCAAEPCVETSCTDGLDNDGDGDPDCADYDCLWYDLDADTLADCEDCDPADPAHLGPAPEVDLLRVSLDPADPVRATRLDWSDVSSVSGTGTVYDVFTGSVPDLQGDGGFDGSACLVPDRVTTDLADTTAGARWYLVRAENACGPGPPGEGRNLPATPCD